MHTEPLPGHSVPVFHTTVTYSHVINTKMLRQQSGYPACVLIPLFYIEAEMLTLTRQLKTQLFRHLKVFGDTAQQRAGRGRSNRIREFEGKLSAVHIVSGHIWVAASLQPTPGNTKINGNCLSVPEEGSGQRICTDTVNRFTCIYIVDPDFC